MKKKDEIELEIDAQVKILEGNSMVGMDGPLVDREGFPRDDIDVYQVREARNKIICLGNDHKALMKQIEAQLYSIHAEAKDNGTTRIPIIGDTSTDPPRAFAHITMVTEGSPSHNAGLRVGDRVIEFGSIAADNFNGLNDISGVVQHSVGVGRPRLFR
jgi:26S proteasome non-ATPase regulatory subunit 9